MDAIDQAPFNFSPTVGLVVAVMVGFLVFAVALDLTWDQFYRVLRRPRAPLIGLAAQFLGAARRRLRGCGHDGRHAEHRARAAARDLLPGRGAVQLAAPPIVRANAPSARGASIWSRNPRARDAWKTSTVTSSLSRVIAAALMPNLPGDRSSLLALVGLLV
ncbi:MAG: hypothetical protein ACREM1_18080 [Longimicrobiales bacterium]